MSAGRALVHDPRGIGILGGCIYALAVLAWILSRGVYFSARGLPAAVSGVTFSIGGVFLMGAVPLYLLARYSLVLPTGTTLWFLGNTVYQELYGSHLHPLTSYLTVWPLLFGVIVATGVVEVVIRLVLDRSLGRGGLRTLA